MTKSESNSCTKGVDKGHFGFLSVQKKISSIFQSLAHNVKLEKLENYLLNFLVITVNRII